jgi:hypothetical protein
MKKLRMTLVAGFLFAAPAVTALAEEETFDGQAFEDQSVQSQTVFENTWGEMSEEQWAGEHNEELLDAGMVEPTGDEDQSGAQLAVIEQLEDGISVDDEANPSFGDSDDDDDEE